MLPFLSLPTLNVFIRYEGPSYKPKLGDAFEDIAQRFANAHEACKIGCDASVRCSGWFLILCSGKYYSSCISLIQFAMKRKVEANSKFVVTPALRDVSPTQFAMQCDHPASE
jgi:hypothetical protein